MKGFVEREKVRQAEQEEQAKEAREKLEVELENDGKNLYSSEYIDIYTSQPDQDLDDTEWDDGVGTLRLGKRLPQYNFGIGKGMMGAVLDIFGGPEEATAINMKRPKYASLDAVKEWSVGVGYFKQTDAINGVYFVGIHDQDMKAVKCEAEKMDEEWRNCRYTGGLHPENNREPKNFME
ncbi:hypothetical protein KJE20_09982 [Pyrenophora tritici-repentis]|uniref:Uncharacterized protein n=1 Tax=Pyrenophora tritici-repentis TaxID=45151 RepID=A0A922NBG5_9PLEO|nr:hypothetical protein Ptr86124_010247 [Pyrenophora tritici-repentis]KAI1681131.1 hypothetical protein KJE20_09982 [Pyrenophora tritici-repentis]